MIDKNLKRKVITDWRKAFPQLGLYAQDKLYKNVGPIIIGLELIKLPRTEEYRPHFVIYSLWEKDIKKSLDSPFILKEYYNKKRLQFSIPFEKHDYYFNEVLEAVKMQTPLPFDNNIPLNLIISVMDNYSQQRPLSAAPNSYLQAALQEDKLKIALYLNPLTAQKVFEQINQRSWDTNHFKACGVDVIDWLQSLQAIVSNRDEFLKQIELNKQDKKIAQLPSSELAE